LHEKLIEISKEHQKQIGSHGYEHTERVIELCMVLGTRLGADMEVLIPAAILHDIGRKHDNHAQRGAEMAREILQEQGYTKVNEIVHVIDVHSFSAGGEAKTIEAQILSDADKLDAMGAMGIYRSAQYSVEHERDQAEFINHFNEKLLKLKDLLYTDAAKKLADKRHRFMLQYLDQLDKELKGLS
jgi:uncharacterized protein